MNQSFHKLLYLCIRDKHLSYQKLLGSEKTDSKPDMIGRIEVVGICFMRYGYSKLHGTLFNYLLGTLLLLILPS